MVDKVDQFAADLADPSVAPEERVQALQFLLHFVGDMHQPLHAADDHDQGGNAKKVSASGLRAGNLHHYWDTEFVQALGSDPAAAAATLIEQISPEEQASWEAGHPTAWALEAFDVARTTAYGALPKSSSSGSYKLSARYVRAAEAAVALQLQRAGVRLAKVLNTALR